MAFQVWSEESIIRFLLLSSNIRYSTKFCMEYWIVSYFSFYQWILFVRNHTLNICHLVWNGRTETSMACFKYNLGSICRVFDSTWITSSFCTELETLIKNIIWTLFYTFVSMEVSTIKICDNYSYNCSLFSDINLNLMQCTKYGLNLWSKHIGILLGC